MIAAGVNNNNCLAKFIDLILKPVVVIDNQVWRLSGNIKKQLDKGTTFTIISLIESKVRIGDE